MFNKGLKVVIIQLLGIFLGIFSLIYIAGDMLPEVYSLVGVYSLITCMVNVFSHLGLETKMMREALMWIQHGDMERVREYTTQSLVSRTIGLLILSPLVITYIAFINLTKYDGEYTWILISFYIGSLLSAFIDSMSLIVRSQGGYVFSTFVRTMNTDIVKVLGILLYIYFGAEVYLYFFSLSSLPLLVVFIYKLRQNIDFRYISLRESLCKIIENKYLWLRNDMDYFKSYADSLLVSVLFSSTIMGSYTIYKNLENLFRSTLEGFFDVLTQEQVRFKGEELKLIALERKIKQARNVVLGIMLIGTIIFFLFSDEIVHFLRFERYVMIEQAVYCVIIVNAIYLLGKFEINAISNFSSSKTTFKLSLFYMTITIAAFIVVMVVPSLYGVFIQRIVTFAAYVGISVGYFKNNRTVLYNNVLK